jgi:uncharacterized glyoxalase superfamily metalloenzyme YdcJ
MGETSDQIERHIRETRHNLSDNFSELGDKVKTAVDWRAQFGERPVTMIALAFGGGMLLSTLLSSPRSQKRSFKISQHAEPNTQAFPIQSRSAYSDKASQTLDNLKAALVGTVTSKLTGFIEELLSWVQKRVQQSN